MYAQLKYWAQTYAHPGLEDKRCLHDFLDAESSESIASFKNDLVAVKNGNFDPKILVQIIGYQREIRHKSFQEWAKLMILWASEYKR